MQLDHRLLISTTFLVGVGCSPSGASTVTPMSFTSTSSGGAAANVGGQSNVNAGGTHVPTGGSVNTGGSSNVGNTLATGGNATGGTTTVANGGSHTGGASSIGGSLTTGGTKSVATGGSGPTGGKGTTGGSGATGGSGVTGGSAATGGSKANTGGSSATTGTCSFGTVTVSKSTGMATVGTVEFTAPSGASSMQVVYSLNNAASGTLNKGGTAPVDTTKTNNHTLLLGLKQSSTYAVHVEATLSDGSTCKSSDSTLTTGTLSNAPSITRTATNASAQATGFIVTSTGMGSGMGTGGSDMAYIFDADGAVVWATSAPSECSRARMDYEGVNMWMAALNVQNTGGEMRFVSMDGLTTKTNISGLGNAHHDFTVMPKKIAAIVWTVASSEDVESNLVSMASDGTGSPTTVFKVGSNLYVGGQSAFGVGSDTYHANSILYHSDGSFSIGDRNPNLYVLASSSGTVQWQLGGTCSGAVASKCVSETWKVNHGHHYDSSTGHFLVFNNGQSGSSHVLEYSLSTSGTMSATLVKDFTSGSTSSNVLGDVQRLPNGNTLITYSTAGQMIEVDSSWATVQTIKGSFGYADWRETLYGAPPR